MINVTQTFLPPFDEYTAVLRRAWDKKWITNNGELVLELEEKLREYLGVKHLFFTTNGTIVLQMALKALNITKEVITTPFSYVATTNAILWEGCKPIFVDIDPDTFCIDASKIEASITENTQAILATHVYGLPSEVDKIQEIAAKHKLKVIYDAAHAFGCELNGRSLLAYGDIATCSFHATKLFHTVEGGCIVCNDDELARKLYLSRSFGHIGDDYYTLGINGKNSELHAAMGLCVLPNVPALIERRREIFALYDNTLDFAKLSRPSYRGQFNYNYAYYPIVFETQDILLKARTALSNHEVSTRRYFYPSLNRLPFIDETQSCPVSEDISARVLSLPLYYELRDEDVLRICRIINEVL